MAVVTESIEKAVCWRLRPEHRNLLLGPQGLRLDEWLESGQARIVKHGPHRTVYRVDLPDLCFYLKRNRLPNKRAWLRGLVRPGKARMEYNRALAIASRGIPTITPVGLGETPGWKPGESWLITEALEDVEPLSSFLESTFLSMPANRRTRLRQRIAGCLACFMGHVHDAGIMHNDLHAGNILIRLDDQDQPHLYLVDLHAVRLGRPLGWCASRDNLVMLNQWFSMRANRSDRLRFWRDYTEARRDSGLVSFFTKGQRANWLARDLERRTWNSNLKFWRNRDRRCVVENRYYRKLLRIGTIQPPRLDGMAVTDLDEQAVEVLLTNPHEPLRMARFGGGRPSPSPLYSGERGWGEEVRDLGETVQSSLGDLPPSPPAPFPRVQGKGAPGITVLKNSPSSTVVEMEMPSQGVSCPVIYKRFIGSRTWRDWLADKFRPLPALTSWVNGHGLRERCLPTPRPLAVVRLSNGSTNLDTFLLTAKVVGAVDLREYVSELAQLPTAERRRFVRQGIDQLARLVREMHRRQVSHRDLKAVNILVQKPAADFPRMSIDFGPFWLIDLVGVRLSRRLTIRRRVQNLARLNAGFPHLGTLTRSDKLRFLRVYLQWGMLGQSGWKSWWSAIDKATHAKVARNKRNGRPLT
jgi:serine/threonine protein kinase